MRGLLHGHTRTGRCRLDGRAGYNIIARIVPVASGKWSGVVVMAGLLVRPLTTASGAQLVLWTAILVWQLL